MLERKISMPIQIKMMPPKIVALFDKLFPNFLPITTPIKHKIKVIIPIMKIDNKTIRNEYVANVKPTERASIEVAIA